VRHLAKTWRCDERGTTALEFALVAPVFIALLIGTITVCVGLFLTASMHYAVQEAARCASVKTTICSDAASTTAYAQNHYFGPNGPTFSYAAAACGNSVSASISYRIDVGFSAYTVPLSATACFP
jgi:Flp pilus assembly protein TadG